MIHSFLHHGYEILEVSIAKVVKHEQLTPYEREREGSYIPQDQ